jgi:hypothetical protein
VYTPADWELVNQILQNRTSNIEDLGRKLTTFSRLPALDNIPGFVHNATPGTCIGMANNLNMDPTTSIWTDFGSGGICFGIQGSIFNLQTWCLDLPATMKTIASNLAIIPDDEKRMVLPIHYLTGDCLDLDINDYPQDLSKTTHLTNFIGVVPGRSAHFSSSEIV